MVLGIPQHTCQQQEQGPTPTPGAVAGVGDGRGKGRSEGAANRRPGRTGKQNTETAKRGETEDGDEWRTSV